jgi:hypothetical protein
MVSFWKNFLNMLTDLGIEVQVACGIITLICFRWLRKETGEMEGMEKIAKKPIKITDTTLRDGHQSTLATRIRTDD